MEVEMDVAGVHHHHHHQQEISSQTLESMLVCTKPQEDKKPRPPEEALKCPRCDSSNTKFCYYNNYSLTQPRYFCKSCRRYWTKGGTLRNVPVGGGCRKNKRSSSSSATSSNSSSKIRGPQDHHLIQQHPLSFITPSSNNHLFSGLPHLPYDSTCTDLSLAFARLQSQANGSMGYDHFDHHLSTNGDPFGFLENTTNPNRFDHHNVLYNGGNLGNGDMGSVGNLMGLNNFGGHHDQEQQQQQIMNPMFHDHQEQELTCSAAATSVAATPVKQEACNMMRSSEVGLWGFRWQMGAGGADPGTMVHEVESGRAMIGGWNGIGSTNWHGLINSPLM
ncbi:hypothetical protein L1987_04929 [Smallanthus sonchifolius]|uniref:Uncharacterized protein n=1 Tax=Smallanthus sonchifolius TaxID=185202 RepID=A0ACB9JTY9_9ASTR|nr:hypothetical protein L1987_04929 [Smallanthus sonchifolius]